MTLKEISDACRGIWYAIIDGDNMTAAFHSCANNGLLFIVKLR